MSGFVNIEPDDDRGAFCVPVDKLTPEQLAALGVRLAAMRAAKASAPELARYIGEISVGPIRIGNVQLETGDPIKRARPKRSFMVDVRAKESL